MPLEYTLEEINRIAQEIIRTATSKVIAFYGPMGAGKTTLIKILVKELGSIDAASSPTFGLVNEYHNKEGKNLAYHFDFYRLEYEMEALDLGLEDYLASNNWIFMEWPEKIPNLLPEDTIKLKIEILDSSRRQISWD